MNNKVAIVLGTSSGLGLAIAGSLLERGFLVFGGSRNESPIDHENFIDLEFDITQESQIKSFIREVREETEVVDLLVNAAGICEMNAFSESTSLDMRMHLETNVIGYFNFLREFENLIISEETHIINLFSISAKNYFPNTASYSASEFAKKGMMGVIEKEWRKYLIRVTNFFVGAVNTPLWEDYSEVEVDKMLSTDEFIYVFNCVVDAPESIQFPDVTFLHRDGFID
jgi:NAD(P)-dependent dehydrogenase (short-subunit alcohol dehydrogenase family)